MIITFRSLAYLAASLLFILSLRGLSTQETARRGNRFGVIGMIVAVVVTAIALLIPGDAAGRRPRRRRAPSWGCWPARWASGVSSARFSRRASR